MKCYALFLLVLLSCAVRALTPATAFEYAEPQVRVCPARALDLVPPDFDAPACRTLLLGQLDPQQRHLWLRKTLSVGHKEHARLVGLLVSAKASSQVYLNGVLLGSNGRPGDTVVDEIAGQMDVVLPIPSGLLKIGDNQLALRMSSHQGWLRLDQPIHAIVLVPYLNAQDQILRRSLWALLPLGGFVLASCYFASMTWRRERKLRPALLAALSLLPALQLLLEISRGVFAYRYPLHDLRLLGIVLCSVLFGLCLVAILASQFVPRAAQRWLALITVLVMAAAVAWVSDMDGKASIALLIASFFGIGIAVYGGTRVPGANASDAGAHAIALAAFAALNLLAQSMFLDVYFFYGIAALLVFLMVQQAGAYVCEAQLQREQRTRADRLEAALYERALAPSELIPGLVPELVPELVLSIVSLGKIRRIAASSIVHIQGAGDYSELHLSGGENVLHTVGLNALEAELPSYFLRVHRSHLVNTRLVERLQQAEGGTGTLFLQHGMSVPVSRRIMPGVRKALK